VAGRRAIRAAKLSRLLAALGGVSSLTVERKELMLLVRKVNPLCTTHNPQLTTQNPQPSTQNPQPSTLTL
jgi:hypothetical protein